MSEELSIVKEETIENKIIPLANAEPVLASTGETVADTTEAPKKETVRKTSDNSAPVPSASTAATEESLHADSASSPADSSQDTTANQTITNGSDNTGSQQKTSSTKSSSRFSRSSYNTQNSNDDFDFDEDEGPKKHFFRFRSKDTDYSRDQLILSRIKDEDLMDYLKLEQKRLEFLQQAKEVKERRLLTAFQLTISLAAIVAVTYLLKDNPTILISILYIVGIIAALNIWKNPRDKGKNKK